MIAASGRSGRGQVAGPLESSGAGPAEGGCAQRWGRWFMLPFAATCCRSTSPRSRQPLCRCGWRSRPPGVQSSIAGNSLEHGRSGLGIWRFCRAHLAQIRASSAHFQASFRLIDLRLSLDRRPMDIPLSYTPGHTQRRMYKIGRFRSVSKTDAAMLVPAPLCCPLECASRAQHPACACSPAPATLSFGNHVRCSVISGSVLAPHQSEGWQRLGQDARFRAVRVVETGRLGQAHRLPHAGLTRGGADVPHGVFCGGDPRADYRRARAGGVYRARRRRVRRRSCSGHQRAARQWLCP